MLRFLHLMGWNYRKCVCFQNVLLESWNDYAIFNDDENSFDSKEDVMKKLTGEQFDRGRE